jgi:predicted dehydrogenase
MNSSRQILSQHLNVALIGYGHSGKTLHAPLIQSVNGLNLTHVVSSNEAKVNHDLPEIHVLKSSEEAFLLPEVDLVVIATPNDTHFELAKKALKAGKHVVIDKPFTSTPAEARELIELAKTQNKLLSVFHNRRWDSDFLTIKKLIGTKELGELKQFESHFDRHRPEVKVRWKEQSARGGGILNDLGSHLIDQVLQLFGHPDSIQSDLEIQRDGGEGNDYFHISMRYSKLRVILHSTSYATSETPRFVIHGTKGSFVKYGFDTQEDSLKEGLLPKSIGFGRDSRDGTISIINNGIETKKVLVSEIGNYANFYNEVKNSILKQTPNPVPPEQAFAVIEILERINLKHNAY